MAVAHFTQHIRVNTFKRLLLVQAATLLLVPPAPGPPTCTNTGEAWKGCSVEGPRSSVNTSRDGTSQPSHRHCHQHLLSCPFHFCLPHHPQTDQVRFARLIKTASTAATGHCWPPLLQDLPQGWLLCCQVPAPVLFQLSPCGTDVGCQLDESRGLGRLMQVAPGLLWVW